VSDYFTKTPPDAGVISPAALTIAANDASKTEGQSLVFAGTEFLTVGLAAGDTVTSVTLTSPGAAAAASAAGSPYPIVPSAALGTGFGNYTLAFQNGTLVVQPAPGPTQASAPGGNAALMTLGYFGLPSAPAAGAGRCHRQSGGVREPGCAERDRTSRRRDQNAGRSGGRLRSILAVPRGALTAFFPGLVNLLPAHYSILTNIEVGCGKC
jgi:hypothetical protein